ncbi:MAG: hypothetical protein E7529_02175 [Ruminococcaceae bacterium]|nr:hypothetical protein [Oscillospiraceae bacterium]
MKGKDLKIIAVILAVALVFTVLASNAVSVASIVFLAKNELQAAPAGQQTQQQAQPQQQQQAQPQQQQQQAQQSVETTAPAGNSGSTATTPSGNSGSTATTPDANKPADSGATAEKKTDKEVLEIYTTVMNKAKKDKPGYKKVEYQELPSDAQNRVISKGGNLVGTLLDLVDQLDLMTSKEAAEADPEIVEKGSDMRWFPVYKCEKGCYLTDVNAIESTKYEDLGNGKARITIELKDENNPEPMAEGASTSPSNTGAMFSPLSKADIDETINGGVVSAVITGVTYNLTYHDCKAVVEYDTKTNQIIKLEQYMNVAIQGGGKIFFVSEIQIDKQELFNTMVITDFKY